MTQRRRKIPPIPLEIVFDDARVIALPAAGRGMLMNLVWHFWATDCVALPKDQDRLFVIAQAHRPTWRGYRQEIMEIAQDAAPKLRQAFEAHHNRKAALMRLSQRGGGVIALKALREKLPQTDATPIEPTRSPAKHQASPAPAIESGGFVDKLGR